MTTYGTFDDPPLSPYADIELAADNVRQFELIVPRNAYLDLAYCRRHGWCWFCGERPAEPVKAPAIPMCPTCKRRRDTSRAALGVRE